MKLRARWIGPPPRAGDYLMSEVRPRWAYCIEQVTKASPSVLWDPAAKAEVHHLQIVVDRVAKTAVPRHARIHPWRWDRRDGRYSFRKLNIVRKKIKGELRS
jgi:hypothetical protein